MAVIVEKAWRDTDGEVSGDGPSRQTPYIITGTNSYDIAEAALIEQADQENGGLVVSHYGPIERLAENTWSGMVSYGMLDFTTSKREPPQSADELSLDTTGGTKKQSHYLTPPTTAQTGSAPDHKGAINVTKDGIEGADIGEAACKIQISRVANDALVPSTYLNTIWRLTYCVNSATMTLNVRGKVMVFEPGELLFLGAQVQYSRGRNEWRFVYQYAAKPNDTRTVNGMTIAVNGWDYVWVYSIPEPQSSGGAKWVVQVPKKIYSGQVYRYEDLRLLGV